MTHKNIKKYKKFHVLKCCMFSFEGGRLFCSLDGLYGGLGIGKLQFYFKKVLIIVSTVNFFNFWSSKSWIRSRIKLIRIRNTELD
jgi:hypothetical protein